MGGLLPPAASADYPSDSEPLYELVDAATQRLQAADPVAASKWLTGAAITDPVRVQQVLEAVSADAQSAGVPSDYVTTAFTEQINATEAIQYNRFSAWKFDPAIAPLSAPDLSASRLLIDDLNHRMVSLIAADWPVLDSPECPIRLRAAVDAVAQSRQLDSLYLQALDSATRSYCQT
jgi:chorismate mutase